jgi:capsular exopolysaccharide synthesis family protein
VAFNLALTLASIGKKVVLIGADVRNPQLHRYLPDSNKRENGLTEFIMDPSIKAKEIVRKSANMDIDIILSGTIPPNPAELLLNDRFEKIFIELEEDYDFIIVDTAPSMLVTDTVIINKYSDLMLFVVRAGYTDKRLLKFSYDAIKDKRLTNVSFILNNVTMNNLGYGNKYGYAYSESKPSFFDRLFNRS